METTRVYRDSIRYIMVSYRDYRVSDLGFNVELAG